MARSRKWKNSPEGIEYTKKYHLSWMKKNNVEVKIAVLGHYGPEGRIQCCWPGCIVDDIDMLSLDHINNDGCKERNGEGRSAGVNFYRFLRTREYPSGFQTLCFNHQMKKEILRRRMEQ